SPAWPRRADGRLARLPMRPLIWVTAVISMVVVVVVLLRTGDRGDAVKQKLAPPPSHAQRENNTLQNQTPTDSASVNARKSRRDERIAQATPATTSNKGIKHFGEVKAPSPPNVQTDLSRRAAAVNTPGKLPQGFSDIQNATRTLAPRD